MHAAGIPVVALGIIFSFVGAWFYLDPRAARLFKVPGPAAGLFYLPGGIGLALVGIALTIGRNATAVVLLLLGTAAMAGGAMLFTFNPQWAHPAWMKHRGD